MLWVLLAVLLVAVVGLYLLRERGVGRGDSAGVDSGSHEEDGLALDPEHPGDAPVPASPSVGPRSAPGSGHTPEPLSPAHHTLTQLNQALDVHTPRTEAARQALEAAADRRRVAGFLLARAETEQAELTAREGLFYIRAARVAMRMDPGPELTPLPAQPEAGEVTEARSRTHRGHRIDLSPSPSPTTPHHHPGGRVADRLIPAGWYSEQWWRPALATGAWPPGTDSLFTALFADTPAEPSHPGAGIGLDRKEPDPIAVQASTPPPPGPPSDLAAPPVPGPQDEPAAPSPPGPPDKPTATDLAAGNPASHRGKTPLPERDSHPTGLHPDGPDPAARDLPYDDPQYRANGYGITAHHPAPGNNGAEYSGTTRNGHRPHGPRGYEDLGGYEGGAYDPGGLDPPY